jgi:nicotinamide riboside transporter PnuC
MAGLTLGWTLAAYAFLTIGSLAGVSAIDVQRLSSPALFAAGLIGGILGLVAAVWASRKFSWPILLTLVIAAALVVLAMNKALRLQHLIGA